MAKTATKSKTPAKPAGKPAPAPARQAAPAARREPAPAPEPEKRHPAPAVRQQQTAVAAPNENLPAFMQPGGGILARAPDGQNWQPSKGEFTVKLDKKDGGHTVTWKLAPTVQESGLANWGTHNPSDNNSPPAATLMYNFLMAFPDYPDLMPAVLTFQRSSVKHGRKFMTKLMTVRTPLFGSVFRLQSVEDHNSANQNFFNMQMTGDGLVQDEALYHQYKELNLALSKSGLGIRDIDSLQEEPDTTAGGGAEPAGNY